MLSSPGTLLSCQKKTHFYVYLSFHFIKLNVTLTIFEMKYFGNQFFELKNTKKISNQAFLENFSSYRIFMYPNRYCKLIQPKGFY